MIDLLLAVQNPDSASAPGDAGGIDWLTLIVSVLVGVISGVLSAVITSRTQRKLAKEAARERAEQALWSFQRALSDYASEAEGHWVKDVDYFTRTGKDEIEAARKAAYPYRRYLDKDQVKKLLKRNWFVQDDPGGDPLTSANDALDWARLLEEHLSAKFRD